MMAKATKSIRLDLTDNIAKKLNARARHAGYKSAKAYVLSLIGDAVGEEIAPSAWGGERESVKLFTKMAARMKDDSDYIASLMDRLRSDKDADWSEMYKVLDRKESDQLQLMKVALCRIPREGNMDDIRKIAEHAYPDDVVRGIAEVKHILREANITWLLNSF